MPSKDIVKYGDDARRLTIIEGLRELSTRLAIVTIVAVTLGVGADVVAAPSASAVPGPPVMWQILHGDGGYEPTPPPPPAPSPPPFVCPFCGK